jgi:hypothetical protein
LAVTWTLTPSFEFLEAGTVAVIRVDEFTVKDGAVVGPNETTVVPEKLAPLMATW